MENQTDRIVELYQSGKGIKLISKELDLSPSLVRRTLLKQGVYQGAARAREARETTEQLLCLSVSSLETVTMAAEKLNLPDLERWTCRGDLAVRKDNDGWIVSLGGGFLNELVSPPLEGEWAKKGIELSADLRLISPSFGSLAMGIKEEGAPFGDEGSCLLQNAFVPSRFHIKHLCLAPPVLYFKGNSYNAITAVVSGLTVCETASVGLKPVIIPEERRLEAGEKILLTPLWRTDGSTIKPAPWSTAAMLVEFAGSGNLYAALPREAAGHRVCLTVELRSLAGSPEMEIILGDDGDSERLTTKVKCDPTTYRLECVLGRNGYTRISCKEHSRKEVLLESAEIEIIL